MAFQGAAIPNLIIEISGVMICLFALITIWYGSMKYSDTKRYMTEASVGMLFYNLCLLILEFTQAAQGVVRRSVVLLTGLGTYLFPLIAAYIISLFVAAMTFDTEEKRRQLSVFLSILMVIESAALIAAQLTGRLVLVDAAGEFSYGAASAMGFLVTSIFMVFDLIISKRQIMTR